MKTFKKVLFNKEWKSPLAWGYREGDTVEGYVKYTVYFDFKEGFRFTTTVPNASFCTNNPFKCLFRALEYNGVGMGKYCKLKELTRKQGMWCELDPSTFDKLNKED